MEQEFLYNGQLSVSGCQWRSLEKQTENLQELAASYQVPNYLLKILVKRGLGKEQLSSFLNPDLSYWRKAAQLVPGFADLVTRLAKLVKDKQPLALLTDYDVDGLTSAAQLASYLRSHEVPLTIAIPNRLVDGYGPNEAIIHRFVNAGYKCCLMLDCGTGAKKEIQLANQLGMEVLVLDHHCPGDDLPPAAVLCNAFLPNCPQAAKSARDLATAGLVFFVLLELATLLTPGSEQRQEVKTKVLPLLDLAALGTICDMVPIVGINRPLVHYGLRQVTKALQEENNNNGQMNLGIKALLKAKQVAPAILTTDDLAFHIGPCINAASRLGKVEEALQLLTSTNQSEANDQAQKLLELNNYRRELERDLFAQALLAGRRQLERNPELGLLVINGVDWPIGVLGIVAGRVAKSLLRPTIIISWQGTTGVGSGRSIIGVDLSKLVLEALSLNHLTHGGGHKMAIGLRLEKCQLQDFSDYCTQKARTYSFGGNQQTLTVDFISRLPALKGELWQQMQALAPYGCGNEVPMIELARVRICNLRVFGETICFQLQDETKNYFPGRIFRGVTTPLGKAVIQASDELYHCLGYLKANNYQGRNQTYFLLQDLMLIK